MHARGGIGETDRRAAHALLNEHYEDAVALAESELPEPSLFLLQVFLIGLQRLGRFDVLDRWQSDFRSFVEGDAWEVTLIRMTLNKVPPHTLLAMCPSAEHESVAYYRVDPTAVLQR